MGERENEREEIDTEVESLLYTVSADGENGEECVAFWKTSWTTEKQPAPEENNNITMMNPPP